MSEAEAYEFIDQGRRIDKGEKLFELTAEQKANEKKMKSTGTRAYSFTKRERKENVPKAELIADFADFLATKEGIENLVITNKERQVAFEYLGEKYEFTLVQKRKPKN